MTTVVSEAEISAAEDQAAAADRDLHVVEQAVAHKPGPAGDALMADLTLAVARAHQGRGRVERLRALADQQAAALAAREKREALNVPVLGRAEQELGASSEKLSAAFEAAQVALYALAVAGQEHDRLVQRHRQTLLGVPLRLDDVAEGVDHRTGAAERAGLRLRGHWWAPLDPAAPVMLAAQRVAAAVFGRDHDLCRRLACWPVGDVRRRADGLLADVSELPQAPVARPVRPDMPATDQGQPALSPYLLQRERGRLTGRGAP